MDPSEYTYILVSSLGLILSEMLSDGQRLPRPASGGDPVPDHCGGRPLPEEEIWGALSRMGVCLSKNTSSMGSPGSC